MDKTHSGLIYSGVFLGLFAAFLWLFREILPPFIVGIVVAYLLQPLVQRLEVRGLERVWGTSVILSAFMLAVMVLAIVIVPVALRELASFLDALPGYAERLLTLADPYIADLREALGIAQGDDWKSLLSAHANQVASPAASVGKNLLDGLLAGGEAVAGFLSFWALMPVVAFFMMVEWPRAAKIVYDLIPRRYESDMKEILKAIDEKLARFVRGQLSVMAILGMGYAIALTLAGLDYGFIIGLAAGALSIIPMFGSIIGLLIGVTVAFFQSGDWMFVALIAGIFLGGQILEGNVITPKLVGDSVGLHPLWVFFAIIAGGSLLGIVGMLIAVPVAAVVSVLLAFGMKAYKKSKFYKAKK